MGVNVLVYPRINFLLAKDAVPNKHSNLAQIAFNIGERKFISDIMYIIQANRKANGTGAFLLMWTERDLYPRELYHEVTDY